MPNDNRVSYKRFELLSSDLNLMAAEYSFS